MTLPKLVLDIDRDQYSIVPGAEVEEVQVEAGPPWRRRDFFGATHQVSLQLVLEPFAYTYLMAFWRTTLGKGTLPFLIDLIIDTSELSEYQATLVGGKLSTTINGDAYLVTGMLSVLRAPDEADNDDAIIALFGAFGDGALTALDLLAHLVNVDMAMI